MNSSVIWFGFLPVIGFLLLDSFSAKRVALLGALAMGIGEAAYSMIFIGAFDYISFLSLAIMAACIGAALRSRDDYFFKIHGAIVNFMLAAVMLVAWYGFHRALLLDMAIKYIGLEKLASLNPALDKDIVAESLRLMSFHLPWWLVLHSLLTVYAASNWSKWAWAFVRVPGYIITLFLASAFAQAAVMQSLK